MGSRLVLEGLSAAGEGFESLGRGIQRFKENREIEKQREAKEAADLLLKQRLERASSSVEALNERAQEPGFDRRAFAEGSQDVIQTAIETGNTNLLRALTPIESIIKRREEEADREADRKAALERAKQTGVQRTAGDLRKEKQQQVKLASTLNKDFRSDKTTQDTRKLETAFNKIERSAKAKPSAASDIALVFNFMRMNDPGSVVRESEFATAAGARGFFDKNVQVNDDGSGTFISGGSAIPLPSFVVQAFQKLDPKQKGAFLLPSQRTAFTETAEDLFAAQLQSQKGVDENFLALSENAGIDPNLVLGKTRSSKRLEEIEKRKAKRAEDARKADADARESRGDVNLTELKDEESEAGGGSIQTLGPAKTKAIATNPQVIQQFEAAVAAEEAEMGRELSQKETLDAVLEVFRANGMEPDMPGILEAMQELNLGE